MAYPLLVTKLHLPPPPPGTVPRPRLLEELREGLGRPLTLIAAPAGFGKSTLLSEWRATPEGKGYPFAYVSLDSGDNDPGRFWAYVLGALQLPGLAELPAALEADAPPELMLAPLINGLENAGPTVLALDDYHVIDVPAIHSGVGFLVEQMPAGLRLVILSRSDPPWPLARLRAHGRMSELREADLRFRPGEVAAFLTLAKGLDLEAADIAALGRQTEGWIAALQMAAISLQGHPDPHRFVVRFSGDNRHIADYLVEEVLAAQPEHLRRVMLETSIVKRFSVPLCRAITGDPESPARLEEMERKGLFLVALDPERCWFRFHHLFGDLLLSRLRQAEPELIPVLHTRASDWLAGDGQTMEAASHSLEAGDLDRAMELYEQHAGGWWALGHPMFLDFMLRLPREAWARRPAFCAYHAWLSCATGQLDEASALIDTAEGQPDLPDETRSFLTLVRRYIAELTGKAPIDDRLDLAGLEAIPEEQASVRNTVEMIVAFLLQMDGRLDEAAAWLMQAAGRDAAGRSTNAIPVAIPRLARIRLVQGRFAEAEELCRRHLALIEARGAARFYIRGNLNAVLADALRLQGDLDAAEEQAEEAVRCNAQWPIPLGIAMATQALARVRLARGEARQALELVDQEEATIAGRWIQPDLVSDRTALRVQAWLALGDLEAARRWAERGGLTPQDPLSFRRETEQIALARVLLVTGQRAEGQALLSRLAGAARVAGRLGRLQEIRALQAPESPLAEPLTEREREILELLARGCSNQEIADHLTVAVGTVKVHLHNISRKLEVTGRARAVARARELGLLK